MQFTRCCVSVSGVCVADNDRIAHRTHYVNSFFDFLSNNIVKQAVSIGAVSKIVVCVGNDCIALEERTRYNIGTKGQGWNGGR